MTFPSDMLSPVTEATCRLVQQRSVRKLEQQVCAQLDMDVEAAVEDARVEVAEYLEALAKALRDFKQKDLTP